MFVGRTKPGVYGAGSYEVWETPVPATELSHLHTLRAHYSVRLQKLLDDNSNTFR